MKSKKNKKIIFAILIVTLAFALVAGYGVRRKMLSLRAQGWKRDGLAAAEAHDNAKAADLLGRYLQRNSWDTKTLKIYVDCREKAELPNGQHFAEALAALKLLIGQEPDNLDFRHHLLELYVKLERWPEALDTANAILDAHRWPKDLRTLELKTDVLTKLRQFREGLTTAEQWIAIAPSEVKAYMAGYSLRASLEQPLDQVVAQAEQLSNAHPTEPRFELLRGYAYALAYGRARDARDDKQAEAWLKPAVEWLHKAAQDPGLTDDLGEVLVEQFDHLGMSEDALAVLRKRAQSGGGGEIRQALARRMWQMGRWDQTIAALGDVDPSNPQSDATLVAFKTIALANLGKTSDAESARAALAARNQAAARAWTLVLHQILDAKDVDPKKLATECRSALAGDPKNSYLTYYYGDAEARLGEPELAVDAWRRAAALNSTWAVPAIRLVDALVQQGHAELALGIGSELAQRNHSVGLAISVARAAAANAERSGAADDWLYKVVSEIQGMLPGEDRSLLIQIQLLAQKGQKDDAIKAAKGALTRTPAPTEQFILALASVSRKASLGIENDCFAAAEKAYGLTPRLAYARAVDRALAGDIEGGLAQFDNVANRAGHTADQAWRLARAQYLDGTGHRGAREAWVSLSDSFPDDVVVQEAAINARATRGDWDFQQRAIDRLKALTGDKGLAWRLAKARLMVESPRNESDYEQGSVLLTDVIKEYPSQVEPRVLLARALVQMNRLDGAIDQLTTASRIDPTSVPVAMQLASLLQQRGEYERARAELARVSSFIYSPQQRTQAALLLAQQGDTDGAVQYLEKSKTTDSQQPNTAAQSDPRQQLLLAALYRARHEPDKAEAIIKQLLQKPDLSIIQFAASFYASQGRKDEAQKALDQLDTLKLDPGLKELALGSYFGELGDLSEAARHFDLATQQAPTNGTGWRLLCAARAALGQPTETLAAIDHAAGALPADAGFAALKAKSDLLRTAIADAGLRSIAVSAVRDPLNSDTNFELLRTLVEARDSNDIERLASQIQQLAERHPDSLPAQIELVQVLANMGRTNEALSAAQRAMSAFPRSPEPARVAVQLCAATGRWADMSAAAQIWRKRLGSEPMAADVAIALSAVRQHQPDAAITQLQPYLKQASAEPDRFADFLTTYALAAVNGNRSQEAADLLWPLASNSTGWRMRWMQVAVEDPSGAETSSWLDRVAKIIPTDAVNEQLALAESYERLGKRESDEALVRKSIEILAKAVHAPNANAMTFLAAGAAAERRQDMQSAETLYRRALSKDSSLWLVQNNLAMLIVARGGDMSEAATLASAAVKAQPRMATLHDTLAQIQEKAGNPKAAAESERLASLLDPDNIKWRVRMAKYLADAGDLVTARKTVQSLDAGRLDFSKLPPTDQKALRDQLAAVRKQVQGARAGI